MSGEQSLFGIQGKRFMVLGGGQGMGESTVRLLSSLGASIAVVDVEHERAARVAREYGREGVSLRPFQTDVTDDAALIATVASIEREMGPLDGMATVIGMAAWSSLLEMSEAVWDLDHRRNLRYFFIAAREVARALQRRGAPGSIVAVASVDGLVSSPNHASYGAAKAGLVNLVKTMAVEWAELGVRVNAVAPGGIVTPRLPLTDPEAERRGMASLPMRRRGTTDDIAKAVAFFLSEMTPYVTGQTLAVDGGYTAVGVFSHRHTVRPGTTLGMNTP
ncbi:MAG TPA: SDR family NAD(P)-dependent oxidoreductase [Steroidobacteraceae bacterium]|jgi:NAD(P)-dependent dehydrogenase (short-subunit alcohol dehydrogenase family)|nr:SDR family NAD(P)-dependent oxidoreductase [Steroidobacteraceae bacterium]